MCDSDKTGPFLSHRKAIVAIKGTARQWLLLFNNFTLAFEMSKQLPTKLKLMLFTWKAYSTYSIINVSPCSSLMPLLHSRLQTFGLLVGLLVSKRGSSAYKDFASINLGEES